MAKAQKAKSAADPLSDAIALVLADETERTLVLWHSKYQFWTIPLGKIEPGERESDAARREAFEELGIELDRLQLLGAVNKPDHLDEYSGINIFLFRVLSYRGAIMNREPEKHSCFRFLEAAQIRALGPTSFPTQVLVEWFRQGRHHAAANWPDQHGYANEDGQGVVPLTTD